MDLFSACVAGILFLAHAGGSDPVRKAPVRPPNATAVKLLTSDKVNLKGDFLLPDNTTKQYPRSAAVILVHGGDSHRAELWALQRKITGWGAATLTIDLRGHGESALKGRGQPAEASTKRGDGNLLAPMQEDLKSAVVYLRKQKGLDPNRISIVGVDLGAAVALRYAATDLGIKGVGFISPEAEIPDFDLEVEAKKIAPRSVFLLSPLSFKDRADALVKNLGSSVKLYSVVAAGDAKGLGLLDIHKTTEEKLTAELGLKIWLRDLGALTPGP